MVSQPKRNRGCAVTILATILDNPEFASVLTAVLRDGQVIVPTPG
jgi:hypothetical protein